MPATSHVSSQTACAKPSSRFLSPFERPSQKPTDPEHEFFTKHSYYVPVPEIDIPFLKMIHPIPTPERPAFFDAPEHEARKTRPGQRERTGQSTGPPQIISSTGQGSARPPTPPSGLSTALILQIISFRAQPAHPQGSVPH